MSTSIAMSINTYNDYIWCFQLFRIRLLHDDKPDMVRENPPTTGWTECHSVTVY